MASIAYLRRLIDLDLETPSLWYAMVKTAAAFGRYDDRIRYALELVQAEPREAWAMAELADAYLEIGEFDLAGRWVAAAERLSPMQTFKARTRWLAATGDMPAARRLVMKMLATIDRAPGQPMTPAESGLTGIAGLLALDAGDFTMSADFFSRIIEESPTLLRRPPDMTIYARSLHALALRGAGREDEAYRAIEAASELIDQTNAAGMGSYPNMHYTQSLVLGISGDTQAAAASLRLAVDQGWRAWKIERYALTLSLPGDVLAPVVDTIEQDLARMREAVAAEGLAVMPDRAAGAEPGGADYQPPQAVSNGSTATP